MSAKTAQLQIRVTPAQKAALRRLARDAGLDVSAYVLARSVPDARARFHEIVRALRNASEQAFALAALADLLAQLPRAQLADAVAVSPPGLATLPPLARNYVAALLEHAAARHDLEPPPWTRDVAPLASPYFATPLRSLRLHLLQASPAAFRRRNLFIDPGTAGRV